jgi:glycosyltransferase involved in cell wall biosynthesis
MRWLFGTTRFPWPLSDGHWLRVYHLARTLREEGDAAAVLSFDGDAQGRQAYESADVEVLSAGAGEHVARGRARTWLGPHAFDARLAASLDRHAPQCDAVVLSGDRMLQYAPQARRAPVVVADLIDDPVLEQARRDRLPGGIAGRLRGLKGRLGRGRHEREALRRTDCVTFVSDVDCRSFLRRHHRARVECVPNGVDVDWFQPPDEGKVDGEDQPAKIVFTGRMSNPNNERAAAFLVREVAPRVWRRRPDAVVQIVGAAPTAAVRSLAGERVRVTGEVADMRPYLWGAGAVVLAMQSGTGIKNKLLEAWAAGAAVVATPLACQGAGGRDGHDLLVAERPDDLAEAVLRVLGDRALRRRLAEAGRDRARTKLTWSAAAGRLRELARLPGADGGGGRA